MSKQIAFVYPIIRTDYVKRSLETLYKYTHDIEFDVYVVDGSIEKLSPGVVKKYIQTHIPMDNPGFSRACNIGIITALRNKQYEYLAMVNDDTEFMHEGWLTDALEEFKTDKKILAVCPESPRVPMWGYGLDHGEHVDIIKHKETFTPEDIAYLKQGEYKKECDGRTLSRKKVSMGVYIVEIDINGKITRKRVLVKK